MLPIPAGTNTTGNGTSPTNTTSGMTGYVVVVSDTSNLAAIAAALAAAIFNSLGMGPPDTPDNIQVALMLCFEVQH